jgi:hypothetical protein
MSGVKQKLRRLEQRARWDNEPIWRYVLNAPATVAYRRSRPQLRPEASRVLSDLKRDGVAVSSLEALTGDPALLGRLQQTAWDMERALAASKPALVGGGPAPAPKPFLVELLDPHRPEVAPDSLLATTALNSQLKGIADSYFGLETRVNDINVWRNLPRGEAPSSSQLWHRDIKTDRVMVKAFVYLEDVTPVSGPFSYAVGTHPAGDADVDLDIEAFFDGINDRIAEERAAELHRREQAFTGAAGTVLFADMAGYHRGGFATASSRFLMQIRYASLASNRLNLLRHPSPPVGRVRGLAYDRRLSRQV